jgi:hypothetical protein
VVFGMTLSYFEGEYSPLRKRYCTKDLSKREGFQWSFAVG